MDVLQWLDKNDDVKSCFKVGLLVGEILHAYYDEACGDLMTSTSAARSLQRRYPVKLLGKVTEELAGRWAYIGSYENNRILGIIKPNLRIIVKSNDCFFTRPYYEISEAVKSCSPVSLLGEFNLHKERRAGFHNSYAQAPYDRLCSIGLLEKLPGKHGKYVPTKTGLKIFDGETIRAWESLKNWKYRKKFFK